MKLKILVSAIFISLQLLTSQTTAQQTKAIHTPLWKVVDPVSKHVSYMFGTFHTFGASWLDSITVVKEKFLEAKCILVERNFFLDTLESEMQASTPYNGPDIVAHKIFSNEDYPIINQYLKMKGWGGIDSCLWDGNDQPILTLLIIERKLQTDYNTLFHVNIVGEDFMDLFFVRQANLLNKKLVELDNRNKFDSIISRNQDPKKLGISISKLAQFLYKKIQPAKDPSNLIIIYKDIKYQYRLKEAAPKWMEENGLNLTIRNNLWITKLSVALHENDCFIAVGLAHLNFKEGLITELRKAGFKVTPVFIKRINKQVKLKKATRN